MTLSNQFPYYFRVHLGTDLIFRRLAEAESAAEGAPVCAGAYGFVMSSSAAEALVRDGKTRLHASGSVWRDWCGER